MRQNRVWTVNAHLFLHVVITILEISIDSLIVLLAILLLFLLANLGFKLFVCWFIRVSTTEIKTFVFSSLTISNLILLFGYAILVQFHLLLNIQLL